MIMMTPSTTNFIADFAADCFNVNPRNAPIIDRRKIPATIEVVMEYILESKTSGSRRARDAKDEVVDVTSPDSNARRCIFESNS